jgi:hypothetical protein
MAAAGGAHGTDQARMAKGVQAVLHRQLSAATDLGPRAEVNRASGAVGVGTPTRRDVD